MLLLLGVLHAGLIYGLTNVHGAKALQIVPTPIEVTFLEEKAEPPPAPPPPRVARLPTLDIVPPIVDIAYLPPPSTTAITLAQPPEPNPPPVTGPAGIQVSEVDFVRPPVLRYPPSARRTRVEGTVFLRVLIDVEGHASEVKVYRSSGSQALDDAACAAVRSALFKPHRENGVARVATVTIPVEFSLKIREASARGERQARLDTVAANEEGGIVNP